MNENMMNRSYEVQVGGDSLGRYTARVLGWMFTELSVTFIVAAGFAVAGTVFYIYPFRYWPLAPLIAEPGAMICLSAGIKKISVGMTRGLFSLYAALNDIVFSVYSFALSLEILWMVFDITALLFGIMVLIGWFTNISFTKLCPFMTGGLVSLFFYWIFAMLIDLSTFGTVIPTVGIFLFLMLTAYDMEKIQILHAYYGQMPEIAAGASIFSAPQLYLDFADLFVYIMRVLGRGKQARVPTCT